MEDETDLYELVVPLAPHRRADAVSCPCPELCAILRRSPSAPLCLALASVSAHSMNPASVYATRSYAALDAFFSRECWFGLRAHAFPRMVQHAPPPKEAVDWSDMASRPAPQNTGMWLLE